MGCKKFRAISAHISVHLYREIGAPGAHSAGKGSRLKATREGPQFPVSAFGWPTKGCAKLGITSSGRDFAFETPTQRGLDRRAFHRTIREGVGGGSAAKIGFKCRWCIGKDGGRMRDGRSTSRSGKYPDKPGDGCGLVQGMVDERLFRHRKSRQLGTGDARTFNSKEGKLFRSCRGFGKKKTGGLGYVGIRRGGAGRKEKGKLASH